jgi:hypothetical protein
MSSFKNMLLVTYLKEAKDMSTHYYLEVHSKITGKLLVRILSRNRQEKKKFSPFTEYVFKYHIIWRS